MIFEIAQIEIKPGTEAEFTDAMRRIADTMEGFPGYHDQQLHRDLERENWFYLIARWDSLEDHTVAFSNSQVLRDAQSMLVPLMVNPPIVHHTEVIADSAVA